MTTNITGLIIHTQAEINNLEWTKITVILEHDVCWFEIPVHNTVIMDKGQTLKDAADYGASLKVCELSFFVPVNLFDQVGEAPTS